MSKINVLNEHLTNMIAAGEVVERPMGIVKELVENSIDAFSSKIEIKIELGGNQKIEVKDDGVGMDKVDAVNAFSRHATSKIKDTDDLWSISTMGFRGEALPSIASVSKVTLISSDGTDSTKVVIDNGKLISASPYPSEIGTRITVENLFYKTPARLKHLKNSNIETNAIIELIEKFALANPQIAFSLYCDDKLKIETLGHDNLQEVLLQIYGLEMVKHSIPFSNEDYDFKIDGLLVLPSVSRGSKQYMNFFINKRLVRNLNLQKAVIESYSPYLMSDRYPIIILNIHADYRLIDVNVHPSKWEIRLSKDKQLYSLVKETIEKTLRDKMNPGQIHIEKNIEKEKKVVQESFSDFVVEPTQENVKFEFKEEINEYKIEKPLLDRFEYLGQLHGKYILACDEETLYVVDQHAAMERCMYEQIQNEIVNNTTFVQPLLVPTIIDAQPNQINQIDKLNEVLKCINVELEVFSNTSFAIRNEPVWFEDIDETTFLKDLIDLILTDKQMDLLNIRKDKIATLACHSSVRFNHVLTIDESKTLLHRLSQCAQPFNCPHGRPTMMAIKETQLEKEFKRV